MNKTTRYLNSSNWGRSSSPQNKLPFSVQEIPKSLLKTQFVTDRDPAGIVAAKQAQAIISLLLWLTAEPTFLMQTSCLDYKH